MSASGKDSKKPSSIKDYVPYLLAQAHRNVHLGLDKILKNEGVQVEHWRILDVISDEAGRSMGDLADIVLMNHPALTKMLDRMVAKGLVHRLPDPLDQRRILVFITDQGLELHARLSKHVNKYNDAFYANLGPEKITRLKSLLEELMDGVNEEIPS